MNLKKKKFDQDLNSTVSRVIPLGAHFASGEAFVFVIVYRVIPATELVEYFAAEVALEFVKAVHRMRRVAVGRNSEHIVLAALVLFGRPYGGPLQSVGGHKVAHER